MKAFCVKIAETSEFPSRLRDAARATNMTQGQFLEALLNMWWESDRPNPSGHVSAAFFEDWKQTVEARLEAVEQKLEVLPKDIPYRIPAESIEDKGKDEDREEAFSHDNERASKFIRKDTQKTVEEFKVGFDSLERGELSGQGSDSGLEAEAEADDVQTDESKSEKETAEMQTADKIHVLVEEGLKLKEIATQFNSTNEGGMDDWDKNKLSKLHRKYYPLLREEPEA
jgi:hypothetical protein